MRCWLIRSLCLLVGAGIILQSASAVAVQKKVRPAAKSRHVNELTLAGLRPGKDKLEAAAKVFKPEHISRNSRSDAPEWVDGCTGRFVRLEIGRDSLIEGVTVSELAGEKADCPATPPAWLRPQGLRTGRGVGLGSSKSSVVATYGLPQSTGPSTHSGRPLELLYYAFDWAGTEVPQVMEITIERGRVVQITLAFPSL